MNVQDEIDKILAESPKPKADLQLLRDRLRECLAKGFPTGSWWASDVLVEHAIEQLDNRKGRRGPRAAKS